MVPRPDVDCRLRLFCFPHAGGGATTFQPWVGEVSPAVELCAVQLPGRETRLGEAHPGSLRNLVSQLSTELQPLFDVPFAFFGHSMGALVAFELTRQLRRRGQPMPMRLLVSGRPAPHISHGAPSIRSLPDIEFIREVSRKYNGIPRAVLDEPELLALVTPVLRADIAMVEMYAFVQEDPLGVPISVFCGIDDTSVDFEELDAWRQHTSMSFRLELLPGDHFFPHTSREMLLASIGRDLEPFSR